MGRWTGGRTAACVVDDIVQELLDALPSALRLALGGRRPEDAVRDEVQVIRVLQAVVLDANRVLLKASLQHKLSD
jgi:hypothetical protein